MQTATSNTLARQHHFPEQFIGQPGDRLGPAIMCANDSSNCEMVGFRAAEYRREGAIGMQRAGDVVAGQAGCQGRLDLGFAQGVHLLQRLLVIMQGKA